MAWYNSAALEWCLLAEAVAAAVAHQRSDHFANGELPLFDGTSAGVHQQLLESFVQVR